MKKLSVVIICLLVLCSSFHAEIVKASQNEITGILAYGASANDHKAELAVDNKKDTFWQSPDEKSMKDYRRFIDFDLNGLYQLSSIEILNKEGAYYHYEIYASVDGVKYDKVAYKDNNEVASTVADHYDVNKEARYIRVNMSYNSKMQAGNIIEFKAYGNLLSKEKVKKNDIQIEKFQDSKWGKEWNKFETDKNYAKEKTILEMQNLVGRVIGEQYKNKFVFSLRDKKDGKDVFTIEDGENKTIKISGNNGISMAAGFNYYLHHYAKVDYNPLFASNLAMPNELPSVGKKLLKYTDYEYRYALNFCTYSYTMAFWGWNEYQEFLDWCAMNGVNLVLDIVGQEEVLRQTLLEYNYTSEEVKEYISGPAYYAWFYMQNLYSAGGPLPDNWFTQRVELGRMIHDRMQVFGIKPVIQGFGGQVPVDFQKKNPDSIATSSGGWPGYDRPFMIKTYLSKEDKENGKKDYFQMVGDTFYDVQRNIFGDVSNFYAVDPFHEGGTIPNGLNIVDINKTVQKKMIEKDADAIWVMQQWQWGINEEKLTGLANKNQAIVLDLQSDLRSQKSPMENQQVPWIWNMLHNFGGRMGMDGVPEIIATEIPKAYKDNKYMKGIGITPEALENSPIVYDLLFDMTWEQDPINLRKWTENYIERRYGGIDSEIIKAWNILLDTAYKYNGNYYQGASESVINATPRDSKISSASTWGHSDINYDKKKLEEAAQIFINNYDKYKNSDAFLYDFVDIMRQVLANSAQEYQPIMGQAYRKKDLPQFKKISTQFLEIVEMQDKILSTSDGFLLGTWINDSRSMLTDMDDWSKDLFEYNARSLITIWGLQKNSSLNDYSNRQWAGLTGDYYYKRWSRWIENCIAELEGKPRPHETNWFMYGLEWATRKSDQPGYSYATTADKTLNTKELAQTILNQYSVIHMKDFIGDLELETSTNITKGKSVINTENNQLIKELTDGDTDTGWAPNAKKAIVEVDLNGKYSINKVGFSLQQIAAKFHTKYIIEVFDGSKWIEVARSDVDQIDTTNEHTCDVVGTKLRYTFESTNEQNLSNIYELVAIGSMSEKIIYKNLSLKAIATSSASKPHPEDTTALNDGTDTPWVSKDGKVPAWVNLDLETEQFVDKIVMKFEKGKSRSMAFIVTGIDEKGNKYELYKREENLKDKPQGDLIEFDVNKNIKSVKVDIQGAWVPNEGNAWPLISELEILQKSALEVPTINIAPTAIATSSESKPKPEDASALIDGKETAWVSNNGAVPAWVKLELPENELIEKAVLKFEKKAERSMAFIVTGIDEKGLQHELYKRGEELKNTAQGEIIEFDVNKNIKSIRVDIKGAWVPNKGTAWPLIAEIELYAKPKNIADQGKIESTNVAIKEELQYLSDHSLDKAVSFSTNDQVSFKFNKEHDINMIQLDVDKNQEVLKYLIEYKTSTGEFKKLFDDKNRDLINSNIMIRDTSVLTDEIRFTFYNKVSKINEISIYQVDVKSALIQYISKIEKEINGLNVGVTSGTYDINEINKVKTILKEAKDAIASGLNSTDIDSWIKKIEEGMHQLYKNGFIHVSKDYLYGIIDDAEVLEKVLIDKQYNQLAKELVGYIDQAMKVAQDKNVSQQAVTDAEVLLKKQINEITKKLDAKEEYQVVLSAAKQILNEAKVGLFEGQYSEVDLNIFAKVIAESEKEFENASSASQIRKISEQIKIGQDKFLKSKIHIKKEQYQALMVELTNLDESLYDKVSFQVLQELIKEAKNIDFNKITQANLDELCNKLIHAKQDLVKLNRIELENYIKLVKNAKEEYYTKDSWASFHYTLLEAEQICKKNSVSQAELDNMKAALAKVYSSLVLKKADYTKVDYVLNIVSNLNKDEYENFDIVEKAINSIVRDLDITKQSDVNDMAKRIEEAITALRKKEKTSLKPNGQVESSLPETGVNTNTTIFTICSLLSGAFIVLLKKDYLKNKN